MTPGSGEELRAGAMTFAEQVAAPPSPQCRRYAARTVWACSQAVARLS